MTGLAEVPSGGPAGARRGRRDDTRAVLALVAVLREEAAARGSRQSALYVHERLAEQGVELARGTVRNRIADARKGERPLLIGDVASPEAHALVRGERVVEAVAEPDTPDPFLMGELERGRWRWERERDA